MSRIPVPTPDWPGAPHPSLELQHVEDVVLAVWWGNHAAEGEGGGRVLEVAERTKQRTEHGFHRTLWGKTNARGVYFKQHSEQRATQHVFGATTAR